jgi:nucleotide-binding universal stress UspA family protein
MSGAPAGTDQPRYVVAYGGDKRSKAALRLGVTLAQTLGARLDVVLVVRADDPFGAPYPPSGDVGPLVEAQALGWLEEARGLVPGDVPVATHLRRHRSVAQGILEAVAELGARLVVVGTAAGPGGFTVGAVATHLLHASPVPVALTPRGYEPAGRLRRIYCAVGTRPGAQLVVREAVEAARRTRTDLRLVSLVELDEQAGVDDEARRRAEKLMRQAVADVVPDAGGIEIGQGRTMRQAIDSIGWEPRSVLLVGSSRLAPGRQTFLGTTAARMLRHLPVPMVVVPRSDGTMA